jgi:hypothetical protein
LPRRLAHAGDGVEKGDELSRPETSTTVFDRTVERAAAWDANAASAAIVTSSHNGHRVALPSDTARKPTAPSPQLDEREAPSEQQSRVLLSRGWERLPGEGEAIATDEEGEAKRLDGAALLARKQNQRYSLSATTSSRIAPMRTGSKSSHCCHTSSIRRAVSVSKWSPRTESRRTRSTRPRRPRSRPGSRRRRTWRRGASNIVGSNGVRLAHMSSCPV